MNLNLFNLFTRKESIAGLEISDTHVRVALLGLAKKDKDKPYILAAAEEELPSGTVVRGSLQDKPALVKALHSVFKRAGISTHYVIVSIPTDSVFSKVFEFPKNIQGEKLEESMKLTIGFQLPVKPEEVHLDWEKLESTSQDLNDIYLAAIPNAVTNAYIDALKAAKLSPVAIETHPLSLLRTLVHDPQQTLLLETRGPSSASVHIIRNRVIRVSRTIPYAQVPAAEIPEEIRKIQSAFDAANAPVSGTLSLQKATIKEDYATHPLIQQNPGAWLIALGSAERGLLDRSADTLISLMPIGTEEAYEYQKAIAFMEFMANTTIGLAIFFSVAFVGALLFMNSLQERSNNQLSQLNTSPPTQGAAELEQRAQDINLLLENLSEISDTFPRWDPVIEELRSRTIPGIIISNMSVSSPGDPISMNGVAKTRSGLNDFKKKLSESPVLIDVNIPLSYLDQRENIPFSASFKLKDPDLVYTQ